MKKKQVLHGLAMTLAGMMLMTGCSVYHPQSVDIPLINHQGDLRIDGSVSVSAWVLPDVFTLGATASYGVNDWLAVQGHFNYGIENLYGQAAAGGYLPIGENAVFEGYAGVGVGSAWRDKVEQSDSSSIDAYSYNGSFVVPYGQLNFGWHDLANGHIDLGFGVKVGAYIPSFEYHAYDDNGSEILGKQDRMTTASFLIEPQLVFRAGGEKTKFNIRVSACRLPGVENSENKFIYDFVTLSMGMTFNL